MLRSIVVLPLFLSFLLIACSKDQPAPVAPSGKVSASSMPAPTNLRVEAITDTSALLIWGRVPGADDYDLFYKSFSATQWSLVSHQGPDTSATVSGLIPSTEYRWTVKADSADQSSDWASASLFKTLGLTSIALEVIDTDSIEVASDPALSQFNIQLIFPDEVLENELAEKLKGEATEIGLEHIEHLSYKMSPEAKQVIREAAQIWEKIIVGDVPSSSYAYLFGDHEIEYEVDDVIIIVEHGYERSNAAIQHRVDGAMFNHAGQIFLSTYLLEASANHGKWDALSRNELRQIAVHEIGHVLGLTSGLHRRDEFVKDGAFVGANAMRRFGGKPIPLLAPLYAHWDPNSYTDGVMGSLLIPTELIIADDIYNFVTDVEVAALEDFGYEVDYTFARTKPFEKPISIPLQTTTTGEQEPERHRKKVGWSYSTSHILEAITGSTGPFTVRLEGELPPGFSFTAYEKHVAITGNPVAGSEGVYDFVIVIKDGKGNITRLTMQYIVENE